MKKIKQVTKKQVVPNTGGPRLLQKLWATPGANQSIKLIPIFDLLSLVYQDKPHFAIASALDGDLKTIFHSKNDERENIWLDIQLEKVTPVQKILVVGGWLIFMVIEY